MRDWKLIFEKVCTWSFVSAAISLVISFVFERSGATSTFVLALFLFFFAVFIGILWLIAWFIQSRKNKT